MRMTPTETQEQPPAQTPESPPADHRDRAEVTAQLATGITALALLQACGGGGGNPVAATPGMATEAQASRFLQHAQFSASSAEIGAVKQQGMSAWLDAQLQTPSSQSGWNWLVARGYSTIDSNKFFQMSYQANHMAWQQIMSSPDGVRRRCALALSEYFVVSLSGVNTLSWPQFAMARYWDILCEGAFGNFRTLLENITLCTAMGVFLNTLGNQKEDPSSGRLPDENYAREVMQLFTIGLQLLNIDGTPQLNGNGQPIDSYTQADVSNLARVFTGYVQDDADGYFQSPVPPTYWVPHVGVHLRPMKLDASRHSSLEKNFLGVRIPAQTEGRAALTTALDTLFNHPNVGPFFARQMIQRLVCSNPSPAYVARVATVFNNNGLGIRGDLAAVWKAILLDVEATDEAGLSSPTYGKLREPMVRLAQWARTFKTHSIHGTWKIGDFAYSAVDTLSQSPLNAPSVFNFFRPGYSPSSTNPALSRMTLPEFQIVNESAICAYINCLQNILPQGIWVNAPALPTYSDDHSTDGFDIVPDYRAEFALIDNPTELVRRLNLLMCANQLSEATVQKIVQALRADGTNTSSSTMNKTYFVARAIMFVMCSAEYLVQK
jgi:uncharacterized protein (DUF1800 family)